jgi:hypothetical protein
MECKGVCDTFLPVRACEDRTNETEPRPSVLHLGHVVAGLRRSLEDFVLLLHKQNNMIFKLRQIKKSFGLTAPSSDVLRLLWRSASQ